VIKDDDAPGAALGFYQRFHLRVVDPADLVLVVEIGDLGVVMHKPEAVALQREAVGIKPAVVQCDAPRVGLATANPRVGAARRAHQRDGCGAGIDKIVERRFDRLGIVQFCGLNHDGSFSPATRMIDRGSGRHNYAREYQPR
jgi:hypothetical protein